MAAKMNTQRGDMRLNLIIGGAAIGGLLLLAALIGLAIAQLTKPPANSIRGVADTYISALFQADTKTTYSFNSSNYKKLISESDWDQFITKSYKNYPGSSPAFVGSTPVQDNYQAYAQTQNPQQVIYSTVLDHKTYDVYLILVMDDNFWKIDEVDTYKV